MQNFSAPIPLSLYIHIPWCVRKCPYCDFNSHESRQSIPEAQYVDALLRDLDNHLPLIWGRRLVSIFFGGGTPSLFSPESIEKILLGVHSRFSTQADLETTLEANPGTVDESRFRGFRQAGINRLSIGIQSLQDDKLKALGRIHNRDYALRAIETAKQAGFDNFNVDLMHGLPQQSLQDAACDLQDALTFQPPHLSWYQLTIEPNTLFHAQPPPLPKDNILADIQEQGSQLLMNAGLQQYEVSAYARPGHECQHNLNYWEFGDYLGIGAGAHSKITDFDQQVIRRHWQPKHPKDYLTTTTPCSNQQILTEQDTLFEFMLNALRLTQGVPSHLFTERTGLPLSRIESLLTTAINKNLLMNDPFRLCATPFGQQFLNNVIELFLPNTKTAHNTYQQNDKKSRDQ